MARYLLVLCLAVSSLAVVATAAKALKCPKILGKYPFDATKFVGDWHVISGADSKLDGVRCVKVNMKLPSSEEAGGKSSGEEINTMKGTYKAIIASNSKPVQFEQYIQAVDDTKSALSWTVYKKEGATEWSSVFKSSIIATDYENYAVLISCKPAFDAATKTFGRTLTAKILGRSKVLSKDVLSTLTNVLSGYDIDIASVRLVDQTKCDAPVMQAPVHHAAKPQAAGKH